ncbi:MAG: nitronate monooxygenase [Bacteroidota bacterium]|nr:nitronate monooxygenase [Bacteroidota bacterium]
MFTNRVTQLLNIDYPILQAGMVWASGWRLASAVSNAGGLGIIGAGSMYPVVLDEHIKKCKVATNKPFAVNLPLLYADIEKHIEVILQNKINVVVTSAGNPAAYTSLLKKEGIKVLHVVSSKHFAQKAENAGCDAVIAEGFEAGGHNGREETTTMVLVPLVCSALRIPVIAAGGIATGRQMLACMVLGAEGVQIGSRFVASNEASSHQKFKNEVINSGEGDTVLTLKELVPVRIMKNNFYEELVQAKKRNASAKELENLLGKGRAKKGMFEGDLIEGELEIGQVSALLKDIKPAADIIKEIWLQFNEALNKPLK